VKRSDPVPSPTQTTQQLRGLPLNLLPGLQAVMEPSSLDGQDGKRPDWLTLIPWQGGSSQVWDVTVVSPLAASYVDRAATDAGVVADMATSRNAEKNSSLSSDFIT